MALYCGLIFALSHMPGDSAAPSFIWKFDKLAHALEYGVLGWLLTVAVRGQFPGLAGWQVGALALVVAAGYAAGDEWHQSFIPGRSPSLMDLLADVVGATTCIAMSVFVAHRKSQR